MAIEFKPSPAPATFIGYSIGLLARTEFRGRKMRLLVKVEFVREADGSVTLRAKNGHNLNDLPGVKNITAEEYDARPDTRDANGDVAHARWAFGLVGWTVCE